MGKRAIPVLLVLYFTGVLSSQAEEKLLAEEALPTLMDPIVVTASRLPTPLSKTPANTTIITREDIEARQPRTTMDLLTQVSGLHVDQPGGRGGTSSVYLRGSDPNFTVVFIDGIKMNDPTNSRGGSFDFSSVDPASIERIEIVRGLLSSVYGSDAIGGVIHIITREGTAAPESTVSLSGGTHDEMHADIETRGPLGKVDYALQFSYDDDGSPVAGSDFVGKSFNGKLRFSPSKTTWLKLVSRYSESRAKSFPDDSGGPEFSVLRTVDERDISESAIGLSFRQDLSRLWAHELNSSFYYRKEAVISPGVAPGVRDFFGIPANRTDNRFERLDVVWHSIFTPLASTRLNLGVNAQLEKGKSEGRLDLGVTQLSSQFEDERTIVGPFFEVEYTTSGGVILEGGLRVDAGEGFDAEVSPRVGILYRIDATKTVLRANWGEGFKLPSFFALGHPIVGNTELVPETSRSTEVGLTQRFSENLQVRGTYFQNRFFNLIDFDEGPPPRLVNRSEVKTRGFEIGFSFEPHDVLLIGGHVTYTTSEIVGSDEVLRNRPKWRGGLKTRLKPTETFSTELDLLYVARVHDSSIPTGDRMLGDYVRVDLAAVWTMSRRWRASLVFDNVLDTDYEEAVGFSAPGVRAYLGLRYLID